MTTKYYLLKNDQIVAISGRIAHMLYSTHGVKAINKVGKMNFIFLFNGMCSEKQYYPSMNKILKKKNFRICENCGSYHEARFQYCPWCGTNCYEEEKKRTQERTVPANNLVELTHEEIEAARFQGKIACIKLYRDRTNKSLRDCKNDVENFMSNSGFSFYNPY